MADGKDNSEALKLVVFRLLHEEFAAPIEGVSEILRPQKLTRMPRAPHFVIGIMNLRGRVFPVIDLKKRLGLAAAAEDARTRVIVVEASGEPMGLLVDEVKEVYRTSPAAFEAAPELTSNETRDYLSGVVSAGGEGTSARMILVLDLPRLLRPADVGDGVEA